MKTTLLKLSTIIFASISLYLIADSIAMIAAHLNADDNCVVLIFTSALAMLSFSESH